MPDHPPLTIDELLSDITFRQWVHAGCRVNDGSYWAGWLKENSGQKHLVRQAADILRASHLNETVEDSEIDEIVAGTWERIAERDKVRKLTPFRRIAAGAAAVAASIAICIIVWFSGKETLPVFEKKPVAASRTIPSSWIRNTNEGTKPQLVILPDSSSVLLLPGSTLSYPVAFEADMREVNLNGAAFFEIAKRKQHPFLVLTNGLMTKVTGTSFSVRAFEKEKNIEVVVKTGHVTVYSDHADYKKVNTDAVTLLPEQHGIFDKTQVKITTGIADPVNDMLAMQHASFDFTDEPVPRLLDSIGSTYGLDIKYDVRKLRNCVLTTSLNDLPLQGKLKIICRALGDNVKYEMNGNRVTVKGLTGCD